jgi:hypothetical protein
VGSEQKDDSAMIQPLLTFGCKIDPISIRRGQTDKAIEPSAFLLVSRALLVFESGKAGDGGHCICRVRVSKKSTLRGFKIGDIIY